MRLHLGYPSVTDEVAILDRQQESHPIETLEQVVDADELIRMQQLVKAIYVDPLVKQYIVSIAAGTREHEDVYLGASPRGSLGLMRTAQALALLRGQDFVMPDFVKELAQPTLAHRVIVNPAARVKDISPETVVADVVNRVPVPGARASQIGRAHV